MVITIEGPAAEALQEFAEQQSITIDEAAMQIFVFFARIYLYGKNHGMHEMGESVIQSLENRAKIDKL